MLPDYMCNTQFQREITLLVALGFYTISQIKFSVLISYAKDLWVVEMIVESQKKASAWARELIGNNPCNL